MEKFNGFSQDEINKVSGNKNRKPNGQIAESTKQAFRGHGIRRMPEKWSRPNENLKNPQIINKQSLAPVASSNTATTRPTPTNENDDDTLDEINLDRSMSKSIEEALFYQPMKQSVSAVNGNKKENGVRIMLDNANADDSSILKLPTMDTNETSTSTNTIDDSSILPTPKYNSAAGVSPSELNLDSPFKGISLKDFEVHRKMITEQNKQKKEMLYKAIEHHSRKTAAESRKIEEIKSELAKLDNDLAIDVSILRKQIDNACVHFANIEKQYMKIEAQFLKSKIDLHNAAEKKELLTEHLCTVIAHNEDRKAQKLSELMEKVGLTDSGEYEPPLTSTNNFAK